MLIKERRLEGISKIKIYKNTRWYDLPFIWQYAAFFSNFKKNNIFGVGSSLISRKIAITRAFYELLERFSLSYPSLNKFLRLSFSEIDEDRTIPYNVWFKKNDVEKNKKINPKLIKNIPSLDDKLYFAWGYNLINREKVLIPAQLIYVPPKRFIEKIIRESNSTGAAAGKNLKQCLIKGILEILERDAFINYYLNEFFGERIDLSRFKNIKCFINKFRKYHLEIYSFYLPSDIEIFNVVTFLIDKSGMSPIINCGSASGFEIENCILKSLEESLQVLMWIRLLSLTKRISTIDLNTLENRGFFWMDNKKLKLIYQWVNKSRKPKQLNSLIKKLKNNKNNRLNYLIEQIKNHNYNIYYSEITSEKFKKLKVKVIKVIIPQLQWIYLGEDFKFINWERIKKIREINNLKPFDVDANKLNKVPHFFL